MGTLLTTLDRARIRARDTDKTLFSDAQLLALINGIITHVHDELINIQSLLIEATHDENLVAGVADYVAGFRAVSITRAFHSNTGELFQVTPEEAHDLGYHGEGRPRAFTFGTGRNITFYPTPDDAYPVRFYYFPPAMELTNIPDDDFPYDGLFNRYIEDALAVEIRGIQERDISYAAANMALSWEKAMNKTYARGVQKKRVATPDMFYVGGL